MLKTLRKQFREVNSSKKKIVYLYFLLYMISAGLLPVLGVMLPKYIIDAFQDDNTKRILMYIVLYAGVSLVLSSISTAISVMSENLFLKLRMIQFAKINRKMLTLDYHYCEDSNFKDKLNTALVAVDSDNIGFQGVYSNILFLLPLLVSSLLYVAILGRLSIFLPLTVFICSIFITFLNAKIKKYAFVKKDEVSHARRRVKYFNDIGYNFLYGKDIRIYNLRGKLKKDYQRETYSYLSVLRNIANHEFKLGLIELALLLLQDGVAYFIVVYSYFYSPTPISLGDVSMYIGSVIALSTAFRTMSGHLSDLFDNLKRSKLYFDFMDNPSYQTLRYAHAALPDTLEIEFKNVSFRYPNTEKDVIQNLNFKIHKGEKLAIVGTNGAGKTTIIKLICGLFYPTEGEILINGIPTTEFNQAEYYKMFSVVFQDFNIYAATILENVIGNDKDEESIKRGMECLEKVGLSEKIESLPLKYNQPLLKIIEENGTEFSGGQNQKIAIARALYKNANMVILDEPTSALDALAEAEIYQNFDTLVKDKTSIYISHRLSSTKFCDHIALFNQTGLAEYGTHDELMMLGKEYYHMFSVQGKYYQEEEVEHEG